MVRQTSQESKKVKLRKRVEIDYVSQSCPAPCTIDCDAPNPCSGPVVKKIFLYNPVVFMI